MTATVTDPASNPTLGEPVQSVTYPISVDYVKSWTLVRALAEALANAIDADPENFTVSYDDTTGELLIEDFAEHGVGVESMVFGWSAKTGRDDIIGQFGEGLKIATIRGVSDPGVRHMVIESVGVTIVPTVAEHAAVSGLHIPVKSGHAPKVLRWDLYPSDRPLGTLVRVGVSPTVAAEVMNRFRHVTDRNYAAPSGHGVVVPDHPGRIWIGGVLVKDVPGLVYGYDLSLSAAKHFQNRDRTVIETSALTYAIGFIQEETTDPTILVGWVRAALDGTLHDAEKGVTRIRVASADCRRAWMAVAATVLGDPSVHYYRDGHDDAETGLSLSDDNMLELVLNGLDRYSFRNLMGLLGVKAAKAAQQAKPEQAVVWAKNITPAEQAALDASIAGIRTVFGATIISDVKVYEHLNNPDVSARCNTLGFYTPGSGAIAVQRALLGGDDPTRLDETLFHEAAHRAAHKGLFPGRPPGVHADRTREFEDTLGYMAVVLLKHVRAGNSLDDITPPAPERSTVPAVPWFTMPAGQRAIFGTRADDHIPDKESALGPRARTLMLSGLLRWAESRTIPTRSLYSTYARENYVTTSRVRQLLLAPIGSQIRYQHFVDVLDPLGVNPAIIWFATTAIKSQWSNRRPTSKTRKLTRHAATDAVLACLALQASPYAEFAAPLMAIAEGNAQPRPEYDDDRWMQPISDALAKLEADLADPEHDAPAAALGAIPGGSDIETAWAAHLDATETEG